MTIKAVWRGPAAGSSNERRILSVSVVSGFGYLLLEGSITRLKPGKNVIVPGSTAYQVTNNGAEDLVIAETLTGLQSGSVTRIETPAQLSA